jgi:hypothetical protein
MFTILKIQILPSNNFDLTKFYRLKIAIGIKLIIHLYIQLLFIHECRGNHKNFKTAAVGISNDHTSVFGLQ